MSEYLLLKWGTIKGWNLETEASKTALQAYLSADGDVSASAMTQHDTPAQKEALCALIDAVEGDIQNDWSGEKYSKEEAKAYVREYGQPRAVA